MNYQEVLAEVNKLADRLGMPVDEGIKHAVTVFNLRGFQTSGSCQGHMGHHGLPYPWIDLDEPEDRKRLDPILTPFNKGRKFTDNLYLKTVDFGINGGCRVMHYQDITARGVKNERLLSFLQKEMNEFADYLLSYK